MTASATFLAAAAGASSAGGGASWWQTAAAMLAVFALLVLFLRLLGRLSPAAQGREAALLAVHPLGARREIQVLRFKDQVHYIYRHEGAMLALAREPYAEWSAQQGRGPTGGGGRAGRLSRWRDLLRAPGAAAAAGAPPPSR